MDRMNIKYLLYCISFMLLLPGFTYFTVDAIVEKRFDTLDNLCISESLKILNNTQSTDKMIQHLNACEKSQYTIVGNWANVFWFSFILVISGTLVGAIANLIFEKKKKD